MPDQTPSVGMERKLAAIMFTDIVGFSRQMGADEGRTLRLLAVHNDIIHQAVTTHHGAVIKTIGDAFLVDFPSVVHAVHCAQEVHTHAIGAVSDFIERCQSRPGSLTAFGEQGQPYPQRNGSRGQCDSKP